MTTSQSPDDTPPRPSVDTPSEAPTHGNQPTHATASFPVPPGPDDATDLSGPFGRYTIQRKLGRGGMGRVYLAHDPALDRLVALKVPHLDAGERATVRERFVREARAAALLHHPNICPVFEVGAVGDLPYLTMAYVEGQALSEWAACGPRPIGEVLSLIVKIARALDEAHRHGVIHRDLKPSNVLLDRRGEPIVMDFGLARRLHLQDEARLTTPGLLMGTPAYMPPEQALGRGAPAPATDVYSLGAMLYELLGGRPPYIGDALSVLAQVVSAPPEPPSRWRPEVGPRLDAICLQAMAREPHDRFPTMAAFAEALEAAPSTPAPPALPAASEPLDPQFAPRILDLFRRWGWAQAVQKMKQKARRDPHGQGRAWQGLLDWMAGEQTEVAAAVQALQATPVGKALRGWALVGQASHSLRNRDYKASLRLLDRAEAEGDPGDRALQASIAHTRAASHIHIGQCDRALPLLHRALEGFGREHFMAGRVLDTLGMAYTYKGNLPIARDLFEQSIRVKSACDDDAGIAVSHGQLGRLYLAWGQLDHAERHLQEDLRIAQRLRSRWSEAQVYNHLGQVDLARGERDARAGKKAAARRHLARAAAWLDQSIAMAKEGQYAISEGFARKDRALVSLQVGDLDGAREQLRLACDLFAASDFQEGLAKAHMIDGMLLRALGRWQDADRRFRGALSHFENVREADLVVRALLEIARTVRDSGAMAPLVTRAYLDALARAEASRHDPLVREVEQELHEADLEAYLRHIYRRARGVGVEDDSPSLVEAACEVGTVLSVDMAGLLDVSRCLGSEEGLVTFNHLAADFADVLGRHQVRAIAYSGSGMLALARDARHAERASRAALDLVAAVEELNRPRLLLDLPLFHVRIGIASGDVILGNVGTYQKMDFTVLGTAAALATSLRSVAEAGAATVSRSTWELVRGLVPFRQGGPRTVPISEVGTVEVWELETLRRPA